MNRKKGVALLSVIIIMSIVLSLSLLMIALLMGSNLTGRYQSAQLKSQTKILEIKNDFLDDAEVSSEYYDIQIKNSVENENIKLLIVSKTGEVKYICVYDFGESKMLASQMQNFALSNIEIEQVEYYSVAGYSFYK